MWFFKHIGGELEIPASDVAGFRSNGPIGVRLGDGTIVAADVTASGGQLQLTGADGSSLTAAPTDFAAVGDPALLDALIPVEIGYFSPFTDFWSAQLSVGFSKKTGNSRSQGIAGDVEIARISPKDRLTLKAGLSRESADAGTGTLERTVEKYYGSVRADVFFGPKFFVYASTGQERDVFAEIDLRSTYNAGFGYQVLASDQTDLRFYVSVGYRREAFTGGSAQAVAIGTPGGALRQKLGPAFWNWIVGWAPALGDRSDFRLLSESSFTVTIVRGLGLRVTSRNEVNNSPPAGVEKHDWLFTTGLTYAIGR